MIEHYLYSAYLLFYGIFGVCIQMLKYHMIKRYKQHIFPFIMASRRIITVVLSVFIIGHDFHWVQFIGVLIIFVSLIIELMMELRKSKGLEDNLKQIKLK